MTKIRTTIDVVHSAEIGPVIDLISEYNGIIVWSQARGPGGGNPSLVLEFGSEEEMEKFLTAWENA